MEHKINIGFQFVPLNHSKSIEMIDEIIGLIKQYNYKFIVTPFETVIECTFEQGTRLMNEINMYCKSIKDLTWLLNIRIHANTSADIMMDSKTMKHN